MPMEDHSQKTSDGRLTASRIYMVRSRAALFKARRRTVVEPPATAVCAEHESGPRIYPSKTLTTSSHICSITGSLAPLTRRERASTRGRCLKGRARIVLNALGESRRGDASTVGARTGRLLTYSDGPCGPRVGGATRHGSRDSPSTDYTTAPTRGSCGGGLHATTVRHSDTPSQGR